MKERGMEGAGESGLKKLQQVFVSLTREGFFLVSKDWTRTLHISESMESVTGIPAEVLRTSPQSLLDALHPDDRDGILRAVENADESECNGPLPDCRINLSGGFRWISLRIRMIPDYEGKKCLAGSVIDITSRKSAELTLKESEKKYRNLINNVQDVIYQCDLNGNIVMVSPRIGTILGYEPDHNF
ncbi:MAG: PAS domain-containing protein, partial [Spirochaetota bacterium]